MKMRAGREWLQRRPIHLHAAKENGANRLSEYRLHLESTARNVRDLRHCGAFVDTRIFMKSRFHIANPTALRPYGLGTAECGLLRDERAGMEYIQPD